MTSRIWRRQVHLRSTPVDRGNGARPRAEPQERSHLGTSSRLLATRDAPRNRVRRAAFKRLARQMSAVSAFNRALCSALAVSGGKGRARSSERGLQH